MSIELRIGTENKVLDLVQLLQIIGQSFNDKESKATLVITAIDDNSLKELLFALYQSRQLPACSLSIDNPKQQLMLAPIVHHLAQEQFAQEVELSAVPLKAKLSAPVNLRKSKINLVKGAQSDISIPMQQQQQQQQLQETRSLSIKRNRKQSIESNRRPLYSTADTDWKKLTLINANNIMTELGSFHEKLGPNAPHLLTIWKNLVGPGSEAISDYTQKITDVTKEAMQQIIEHSPEFVFGLVMDNLPSGFYLLETDNKHILCYSARAQHPETLTPLTVCLKPKPKQMEPHAQEFILSLLRKKMPAMDKDRLWSVLREDYTGLEEIAPAIPHYQQKARHLVTGTESQKKAAFFFFIEELAPELKELIENGAWAARHYQGFSRILAKYGVVGLQYLIHQLDQLKKQGGFAEFDAAFLDAPENYEQLMTNPGKGYFQQWMKLESEQKIWWESLLRQHKAAGNHMDFTELFLAYDYFLKALGKIGVVKLTSACPLVGKHMKVMLDRALYMLLNASDPSEQLITLEGLDFSANGAYFACRYENFNKLAVEMKLVPADSTQKATGSLLYGCPDAASLASVLYDKKTSLPEAILAYYRFIARQSCAYSMELYKTMEQLIRESKLSARHQVGLFAIVALASTSPSAMDERGNPVQELKAFLSALEALHDQESFFEGVMSVIANLRHDRMISLEDLLFITKCLNEPQIRDKISETIVPIMSLAEQFSGKPELFRRLLSNAVLRSANNEGLGIPYETVDFLKQIRMLSRLIEEFTLGDMPDFALNYLVLLQLITCEEGFEPKDSSEKKQIGLLLDLCKQIYAANQPACVLLMDILAGISLQKSAKLPTVSQIHLFFYRHMSKEWSNKSIEACRSELMALLKDQFPDTSFADELGSESMFNLISIVNQTWRSMKVGNSIKVLMDENSSLAKQIINKPLIGARIYRIISQELSPFAKAVEQIDCLLDLESPPLAEVINALGNIEELLAASMVKVVDGYKLHFLAKNFIASLLSVMEKNLNNADELAERYLKNKHLLILMKNRIQTYFKEDLTNTLTQLQTGDRKFNSYIIDQLGELDTHKPIKISLLAYSNHFDTINSFLNSLVRIRNRDEKEYRKLLQLIQNNPLALSEIEPLVRAFESHKSIPVSQQLAIAFEVLKETPLADEVKKSRAVHELTNLIKLQEVLDTGVYSLLLDISFKHNRSAEGAVFPLAEIVSLKSTKAGADAQQADRLFDSLITFIQTIKEGVNAKSLIGQLIGKIGSCAQYGQDLTTLISNLLPLCSPGTDNSLHQLKDFLDGIPSSASQDWFFVMSRAAQHSLEMAKEMKKGRQRDLNLSAEQELEAESEQKAFYTKQLLALMKKLEHNKKAIGDLLALYRYRPYPNLEKLLAEFDDPQCWKNFIEATDKDPKGTRATSADLALHFDTNRIRAVATEVTDMLSKSKLSQQEQYDLIQQLTYVNTIGLDGPVLIDGSVHYGLKNASRAQLRQFSQHLIKQLRHAVLDPEETKKCQLIWMGVLREAYFRSTGKFPRTTQLLSLLLAQNHPDNLIMEIDPGEGKSITAGLLAVMQWVKGGTVDVCTANQGLINQDYYKQGTVDFFNFLGIESSVVSFKSPCGTYKVGGINYSTVSDLSLYRSKAKVEQENLEVKDNKFYHNDLILDEFDQISFDERTQFNYAICPSGVDLQKNPYSWIYPLINEFIDRPEFRNIEDRDANVWTPEKDIAEVKKWLGEHASNSEQRKQLMALTDKKVSKWIDAACIASLQVENRHYLILESYRRIDQVDKKIKLAVPLIQNNPQVGASFSDGVHQFLHARLKENSQDDNFPIDAEMQFVDSRSARDFMGYYYKSGRIVGISGSGGSNEELMELRSKYSVSAYKILSHLKSLREQLPFRITRTSAEHKAEINNALSGIAQMNKKGSQPVLLICKDNQQAKELYEYLMKLYPNKSIRLVTGKKQEETDEAVDRAGQKDSITVSTSLLGRGTDITPDHEKGLLVVQCYLDTGRATKQILGRAARNGKIGTYLAIYQEGEIVHKHETGFLLPMSSKGREQAIALAQRQMNAEGAVERYYTQQMNDTMEASLSLMDQWHGLLSENIGDEAGAQSKLSNELLQWREELICELSELWKQQLEASDPHKKYSNPFVRKDEKGGFLREDLDRAVIAFRKEADLLWRKKSELLFAKNKEKLSEFNLLRADYLMRRQVQEEVKVKRLQDREEKKAALFERSVGAIRMEHASDPHAALLKYSTDALDKLKETNSHITASICNRLSIIEGQFNGYLDKNWSFWDFFCEKKRIDVSEVESVEDKLQHIAGCFDFYKEKLDKMQLLYPIFNDFLGVYAQYQTQKTPPKTLGCVMETLESFWVEKYKQNVIKNLSRQLSWANPLSLRWDYWLERSVVKKAAQEVYLALQPIEGEAENQQDKIKDLYKQMQINLIKLDQLHWIFSWGHTNTRTLLRQGLSVLENMPNITSITPEFKRECMEAGWRAYYLESFEKQLEKVVANVRPKDKADLDVVVARLRQIMSDNNGIYVFQLLENYLKKIKSDKPDLLGYIQGLLHQVQDTSITLEEQHPDILRSSRYLPSLEEELRSLVSQLAGKKIQTLSLQYGHNGIDSYYELRIKGPNSLCSGPFKDFVRYNPNMADLEAQKQRLLLEEESALKRKQGLDKLVDLLAVSDTLPDNIENNPLSEAVSRYKKEILRLHSMQFSERYNEKITSLEACKRYTLAELKQLDVNALPDQALASTFVAIKKGGVFTRKATLMAAFQVALTNAIDNQRTLFESDKSEALANAKIEMSVSISEALSKTQDILALIDKKKVFLEEKLADEAKKSAVIAKAFNGVEELAEFVSTLKNEVRSLQSTALPETNSKANSAANSSNACYTNNLKL